MERQIPDMKKLLTHNGKLTCPYTEPEHATTPHELVDVQSREQPEEVVVFKKIPE